MSTKGQVSREKKFPSREITKKKTLAEPLHKIMPANSLSSFRVNKIKEFEKANSFINEKLKTLKARCNQLHKDNIALNKENEELKASKSKHLSTEAKPSAMTVDRVFETDEDKLAKETKWIKEAKKEALFKNTQSGHFSNCY